MRHSATTELQNLLTLNLMVGFVCYEVPSCPLEIRAGVIAGVTCRLGMGTDTKGTSIEETAKAMRVRLFTLDRL
jgi:hypothetical protein